MSEKISRTRGKNVLCRRKERLNGFARAQKQPMCTVYSRRSRKEEWQLWEARLTPEGAKRTIELLRAQGLMGKMVQNEKLV